MNRGPITRGDTTPGFLAAFERDGILRITHLATTHQTLDQATAGIASRNNPRTRKNCASGAGI